MGSIRLDTPQNATNWHRSFEIRASTTINPFFSQLWHDYRLRVVQQPRRRALFSPLSLGEHTRAIGTYRTCSLANY